MLLSRMQEQRDRLKGKREKISQLYGSQYVLEYIFKHPIHSEANVITYFVKWHPSFQYHIPHPQNQPHPQNHLPHSVLTSGSVVGMLAWPFSVVAGGDVAAPVLRPPLLAAGACHTFLMCTRYTQHTTAHQHRERGTYIRQVLATVHSQYTGNAETILA